MNTNGAIQNPVWWQSLGEIFHRQQDYVVFSIDGLEDTNHIYRKEVDWIKLISNAKAYISTGASAHWDMLVYQHNEHQVDACEKLSRDLGFTWFRAKISKRELPINFERPLSWKPAYPGSVTDISCHALNEKSTFIDAQGRAFACCWLGDDQVELDFDLVQSTWKSKSPHPICAKNCGISQSGQSLFQQQWRREIQLR
jgi:hypothetical protein